ncbi:hypothetical protein MTO96_029863 [Rhipicephalus appendiculatus]
MVLTKRRKRLLLAKKKVLLIRKILEDQRQRRCRTAEFLFQRSGNGSPSCVECPAAETIEHILLQCPGYADLRRRLLGAYSQLRLPHQLTQRPPTFHSRRLVRASGQAEKIGHKKPYLVVKDMAKAIWGREGLAEQSYGGKLAPKDYKNPTAVVRKQLSPEKVAVIIDTVVHWGSKTSVLVKETVDNLSTTLSQKIQDIRRTKKGN